MEEEEEETALAPFIKDQKLPGAGLLNHYGSEIGAIIIFTILIKILSINSFLVEFRTHLERVHIRHPYTMYNFHTEMIDCTLICKFHEKNPLLAPGIEHMTF